MIYALVFLITGLGAWAFIHAAEAIEAYPMNNMHRAKARRRLAAALRRRAETLRANQAESHHRARRRARVCLAAAEQADAEADALLGIRRGCITRRIGAGATGATVADLGRRIVIPYVVTPRTRDLPARIDVSRAHWHATKRDLTAREHQRLDTALRAAVRTHERD
jgi:hypothetical protein